MASVPRVQQNYYVPNINGVAVAITNLSTISIQVLAADPNRQKVTFHNPNYDPSTGGIDVIISNGTIEPDFSTPGGGFVLVPLAIMEFTGDPATGPWRAICRTGSDKSLTIVPSNRLG